MKLDKQARELLDQALALKGLRSTRQREQVFAAIWNNYKHPTADDVFALVRQELSSISLATVYNCLETLVDCQLIREINFGRHPTRYEPNRQEHGHFLCENTGRVFDIVLDDEAMNYLQKLLPEGMEATSIALRYRGTATIKDDEQTILEAQLSKQNQHNKDLQPVN